MKLINDKKLDHYHNITKKALKKVKINKKISKKDEKTAKLYLDMAKNYYSDSLYFRKQNDYVNSFAAVNYAHAWLDAGAIIGLFDVAKDNVLFTVDP
tara:strand:+ start:291 stop:581 length:291 start_codon:yes stop_codon:yes gene_type:complete